MMREGQPDARVLLRRLSPLLAPKADHHGVDEGLRADRQRTRVEDRRDAADVPAAEVSHRHLPAVFGRAEHTHEPRDDERDVRDREPLAIEVLTFGEVPGDPGLNEALAYVGSGATEEAQMDRPLDLEGVLRRANDRHGLRLSWPSSRYAVAASVR